MKVGLANAIITPERPVYMAGFAARTAPSEGRYNDLEASVAVFDNGVTRVGIMSLDLVGVDEFLLDPVRSVAAGLGIGPEGMLVNCSHTHCGPACRVVRGSCRRFDEAYLAGLKETLPRLLLEAVADLAESRLTCTVGSCTLGINRRRRTDDGSAVHMLPNPDGPIDADVPVLRITGADGQARAVLFSYAAHPTTMGGQELGTDYPGPGRDLVREKVPGCLPMFLQGCGGDVKPRNVTGDRRFASGPIEMVYEIGHELGRAVLAALCGTQAPLTDELAAVSAMAELPTTGTPGEELLNELESGSDWERAWAAAARRTIAERGRLAETLPVEVQVLNIGGLAIVGMGGEISCEIGLEVKRELAGRKVWTLGYSNLLRCYVASRAAHAQGGYEVTRAFLYSTTPEPRPLGLTPQSVDVLVNQAATLVGSM